MDECKRSGQIPSFGNWDFSNELPITQYFECARQAGLVRYSSSSGESDPNYLRADHTDLYSLDHFKKPAVRNIPPPTLKKGTRNYREKRYPHHHHHVNVNVTVVKDKESMMMNNNIYMRKQGKVCDVMEQPPRKTTKSKQLYQNDTVSQCSSPNRGGGGSYNRPPKPVDEDLYKIPPELLRGTKRKKMLGFISKCLVPAACVS